jgi:uncharacterized protein (DUF58 family)
MLTARGYWFLVSASVVLALGLFGRRDALVLLGLTLLLWFGWGWLDFTIRGLIACKRLRVRREIRDDRGPVKNLWNGQRFEIREALVAAAGLRLPYVVATSRVPYDVEWLAGPVQAAGPLDEETPLEFAYQISCKAAGLARFEGLRVERVDPCGFFYQEAFLRHPQVVRVLPRLIDTENKTAGIKRHNRLPPPGIHRQRAPGSGSELLNLRDYQTGDPPRTIAWKVSARRDRLITKEYESEVPVRCTLFVDTSDSVRVPSLGGKPLQRLVEIAAGVAQASAAARDLTGLILFDQKGVSARMRPDRTTTHLTRLLHLLADAAGLQASPALVDPDDLLPVTYAFARLVYPERLRPAVNALPALLTWFGAFPGAWRRRGRGLKGGLPLGIWLHRNKGLLTRLLLRDLPFLFFLLGVLADRAELSDLVANLLFLTGCACPPLGILTFLGITLFTFGARRLARWRKRLAALLAVEHGLLPGGLTTLLEDDDAMALATQRFLADHRVPYSVSPYDDKGRYRFAAPAKVDILATALTVAVARGHDNELFVLLVDLLELDDRLDPLLRAVRVAQARHHQVLLVCPWPPGLPLPGDSEPTRSRPPERLHGRALDRLERATRRRFRNAYHRIRRTFTRLGVRVLCAANDESVLLILERLERLRVPQRAR